MVKEILERAHVARSTFYAHFDSKEELLLHSIRHMLVVARDQLPQSAGVVERLIYFSLPILQHIEAHLEKSPAGGPRQPQRQVHERLQDVLIEQVEADIRRVRLDQNIRVAQSELLARFLAATFLVVIDWWLTQQPVTSARDAHSQYRALVEPTLRILCRHPLRAARPE